MPGTVDGSIEMDENPWASRKRTERPDAGEGNDDDMLESRSSCHIYYVSVLGQGRWLATALVATHFCYINVLADVGTV